MCRAQRTVKETPFCPLCSRQGDRRTVQSDRASAASEGFCNSHQTSTHKFIENITVVTVSRKKRIGRWAGYELLKMS